MTKRVFISIEIPEVIKENVAQIAGSIPNLKAHPVDNFHITIKFIGEITDEQQKIIESLMDFLALHCKSFPVTFTSFKNIESRLRLLLACPPELRFLYDAIVLNLRNMDLYQEDRISFEPHVTLGKIALDATPNFYYDFSELSFTANKLALFETTMGENTALYSSLKEVLLLP